MVLVDAYREPVFCTKIRKAHAVQALRRRHGVLLDADPRERHGEAMAIWGLGVMVGPILGPIFAELGVNSVHFAIIMAVNLTVGLLTPPPAVAAQPNPAEVALDPAPEPVPQETPDPALPKVLEPGKSATLAPNDGLTKTVDGVTTGRLPTIGDAAAPAEIEAPAAVADDRPISRFARAFSNDAGKPLFAVLLKVFYLGSARLYLEHLTVALYSHAYMLLALLASFLLVAVGNAFGAPASLVEPLTSLGAIAVWTWVPIYLLLLQKRVYAQGWWATVIKYLVIGWIYLVLVSFAALYALLITVVIGLSMLPAFLGLLVSGPVIGHATWHAYRHIVPRPA